MGSSFFCTYSVGKIRKRNGNPALSSQADLYIVDLLSNVEKAMGHEHFEADQRQVSQDDYSQNLREQVYYEQSSDYQYDEPHNGVIRVSSHGEDGFSSRPPYRDPYYDQVYRGRDPYYDQVYRGRDPYYDQVYRGRDPYYDQVYRGRDPYYDQIYRGRDPYYDQVYRGRDPYYDQVYRGRDPYYDQVYRGRDPYYDQIYRGRDPYYDQVYRGRDPYYDRPYGRDPFMEMMTWMQMLGGNSRHAWNSPNSPYGMRRYNWSYLR